GGEQVGPAEGGEYSHTDGGLIEVNASQPRQLATPGRAGRPPARRRKRWRAALMALAVAVITISEVTARLFIWQDQGRPAQMSAVVMLDRPGNTVGAAVRLARQHRAPFLVISLGTPLSSYRCPAPVGGVKLICFNPKPATTQGEAEFVGRLARK